MYPYGHTPYNLSISPIHSSTTTQVVLYELAEHAGWATSGHVRAVSLVSNSQAEGQIPGRKGVYGLHRVVWGDIGATTDAKT